MDHQQEPIEANSLPLTATVEIGECPVCGASDGRTEIEGVEDWFFECLPHQSRFERCNACASLWIANRLTDGFLQQAYANYYTHVQTHARAGGSALLAWLKSAYLADRYGGAATRAQKAGAAIYRRLARNLVELDASYRFARPAPSRVLDYGFGGGEYLQRMQALGHEVIGVDFDPVSIANARSRGLSAHTPSQAEALDWKEQFDTITLAHVIEHVPDPVALLSRLAGWLRPGGVLFLETPNANAWGLAVFGRYWRGLEAPRHLAIPSRAGLQMMASQCGLEFERQVIRPSVRRWLWEESLTAFPDEERGEAARSIAGAPPETVENTEFLTIIMTRKQDRK